MKLPNHEVSPTDVVVASALRTPSSRLMFRTRLWASLRLTPPT